MQVDLLLSKTIPFFADIIRLKETVLILRFLVLCFLITHLSSPFLVLKILLGRFQLMPLPFTAIFSTIQLN